MTTTTDRARAVLSHPEWMNKVDDATERRRCAIVYAVARASGRSRKAARNIARADMCARRRAETQRLRDSAVARLRAHPRRVYLLADANATSTYPGWLRSYSHTPIAYDGFCLPLCDWLPRAEWRAVRDEMDRLRVLRRHRAEVRDAVDPLIRAASDRGARLHAMRVRRAHAEHLRAVRSEAARKAALTRRANRVGITDACRGHRRRRCEACGGEGWRWGGREYDRRVTCRRCGGAGTIDGNTEIDYEAILAGLDAYDAAVAAGQSDEQARQVARAAAADANDLYTQSSIDEYEQACEEMGMPTGSTAVASMRNGTLSAEDARARCDAATERHEHTDYDALLAAGYDRDAAREAIR